MALRFEVTFDAGPEGAALTTAHGVESVSGAITFRAAAAMKGPFGISMATPANASTFYRKVITGSGALSHTCSIPYALLSLSAASVTVCRWADTANSSICSLSMNIDGKIRILNGAGVSVADSGAYNWVFGQRYRFDCDFDFSVPAAPVLTVKVYAGVDTTVPVATLFAGSLTTGLLFDRLMIGAVGAGASGSTRSWDSDNLRVYDLGDIPGPLNAAPPVPNFLNIGSGGVTHNSAVMRALSENVTSARVAWSLSPAMTSPTFAGPIAPSANDVVKFAVGGLPAGTTIYYQFEDSVDGLIGPVGEFRTAWAAPGSPQPLHLIGMSCHVNGSSDPIFDTIRLRDPDLIMHGGDRGYPWSGVVAPNTESLLVAGFEAPWSVPVQAAMQAAVAQDYLYDDADGPGSNGDGSFPAFPLLTTIYRELFPQYPLVGASGPLYHSFVRGRVRIIRTDSRSASSPKGDPDSPAKTLFGATQDAWFEAELEAARVARQLVLWFNNNEWVGSPVIDGNVDQPRAYPTWRDTIAAMITSRDMENQVIYCFWDTHALAGDDGSGNPYGGFPRFCMAPAHQQANAYTFAASEGFYPPGVVAAAHQFAEILIEDDGDTISTTITGYTGDLVPRVTLEHTFVPFQSGAGVGDLSGEGTLEAEDPFVGFEEDGALSAEGTVSGVGNAPNQGPPFPSQCWPVDTSCCDDLWNGDETTELQRTRAQSLATSTLRQLTGNQVGGCPITVRPCMQQARCGGSTWIQAPVQGGGAVSWVPVNMGGSWLNIACGCGPQGCSCTAVCEIELDGPVGEIVEVRIDGVVVDPATYRVDNGRWLVRQGGECWPKCQDMTAPAGAVNTFTVTYRPGWPVDALGAYAAGVLACEYLKACAGDECRLPRGVTTIARQGVAMTLTPGSFPDGFTGIEEVDAYIRIYNPHGLKQATTVWTPERAARAPRRTTWIDS